MVDTLKPAVLVTGVTPMRLPPCSSDAESAVHPVLR